MSAQTRCWAWPHDAFLLSPSAVVHQHQRRYSHIEAQESLACHSIIERDNGDVLTSGTNIPQASTETGVLVNRGGTTRVEHQVHGLSSGIRRLRSRQPEQSQLRNVERPAAPPWLIFTGPTSLGVQDERHHFGELARLDPFGGSGPVLLKTRGGLMRHNGLCIFIHLEQECVSRIVLVEGDIELKAARFLTNPGDSVLLNGGLEVVQFGRHDLKLDHNDNGSAVLRAGALAGALS